MINTIFAWVRNRLDALYVKNKYIPADKQRHFISGAIGGAILFLFIWLYSVLAISIIAALKEGNDYLRKEVHTPDIMDWVATTTGGIIGTIAIYLIS